MSGVLAPMGLACCRRRDHRTISRATAASRRLRLGAGGGGPEPEWPRCAARRPAGHGPGGPAADYGRGGDDDVGEAAAGIVAA